MYTLPAVLWFNELHWRPVKHRFTFKLTTLILKTLQPGQPTYLRDPVDEYEHVSTIHWVRLLNVY